GPARGQRPEEDPVTVVETVHADAVAEQRATATSPGRVDGEDGDPQLVLLVEPESPDQLVGQRRLPRPARTGDTEDRDRARGRGLGDGRAPGVGEGVLLQLCDDT